MVHNEKVDSSFSIKAVKMAEDAHIGTLSDQIVSSLSFGSGMRSRVFAVFVSRMACAINIKIVCISGGYNS